MRNRSNQDLGVKLFLSIIYPLGAFLYSWKDIKSRSTYLVFFFFFIIYGLCFTANVEAADSFRYVESFRSFSFNAAHNFSSILHEFFSKDSEIKDIFVYALYYVTSVLAGDNYHVLFALVACVFGYFYLRSLSFITNDRSFENTLYFIILALIFTLSNPIFNINGVRFWTAAWVAVYATFQILVNKRLVYLLLLFCLPLIHGSFYVYLAFFLIAYLARHFEVILPYLFIISFFVTDLTLQVLPDITEYLPPFLQNMIWSYTESESALERISGEEAARHSLYSRILLAIPRYYHVLLIILLIQSRKRFVDKGSRVFLGFLLGYGVLVNISSMIPSMMRFWYLLIPLYVYLWVHNNDVMKRFKKVIYWYPVVALYPTFQLLRNIYWTSDPYLFVSNSIHLIIRSLLNG